MSGIFRKLNTLVKATINDALDLSSGRGDDTLPRLDPRTEKDAKRLRERINEAIAYEDELQTKVDALNAEAQQLDQQADDAVKAGQEDHARRLIQQLKQTQRRIEMAEADLRQHRVVAEELIRQVNMMEAAIADAQREQSTGEAQPSRVPLDRINAVFNQAQEGINRLRDRVAARAEQDAEEDAVEQAVDEAVVEDQLEARRQRLSGPPKRK